MAINFPDSPTTGQIFTSGSTSWIYDGVKWGLNTNIAVSNDSMPVGAILWYANTSTAPPGWIAADGSAVSRTTYATLFTVIGTTYGSGDGSTTFNVPSVAATTGKYYIRYTTSLGTVTTTSLSTSPVGTMLDWPTTSSYPTGFLRADGSAVSRTSYADLFSLIGTTYGTGDGSTTFNLPNLVAAGSGSPVKIIKASLGGIVEPSTVAHAVSHTQGGSDVITVTGNQIDNYQTYRNAIINGNMNVWQRSTSSTTLGYTTADRWWINNGGGTTTIAREATIVPARFQYAMKWTQATTANVVGIQSIESINCTHLAGQTVTVSGYFAASASTSFTIDLLSSTSVDVAPASFSTLITPTSGGSGTVSSTTYVRVSGVYVVPSNVKSLAVRINATSLTNGTSFYFTGIQLEVGSTATPYEFEPFETTLRKCQRYYFRIAGGHIYTRLGIGHAFSTTNAVPMILHPVPMRSAPTVCESANLGLYAGGGVIAATQAASPFDSANPNSSTITMVATGLTIGTVYALLFNANINGYLGLGAEL